MSEDQSAAATTGYTPEQVAAWQAAYAAYYYGGAAAPAQAGAAAEPAKGKKDAAALLHAYAYAAPAGASTNPLMLRPARKQATQVSKAAALEGDRNIWWGYTVGDYSRKHASSIPAETRCNPQKDTGYTKGSMSHGATATFCIHFAKGCCIKGEECSFLHRIPEIADELRWEQTKDCFGRDKHENEREDKSGTGSFVTNNRTLYVGHVPTSYKDTEAVVRKHFGQFGELESVRVLTGKAVAFIRYKSRLNAEFAREAMVGQTLDGKSKGKEILNVRWANEDPNPKAQEAAKQSEYKKLLERLQAEQQVQEMWAQYHQAMAAYVADPNYAAQAAAITAGGEETGEAGEENGESDADEEEEEEEPEPERNVKRKYAEVEIIADPENPEETEIAEVVEYEPQEPTEGGSYGTAPSKKRDPLKYPDTKRQFEEAAQEAEPEAEEENQEPAAKKARTETPEPAGAGGLLSKETLEALARNASKIAGRQKKASALSALGGYDSGEDDEE